MTGCLWRMCPRTRSHCKLMFNLRLAITPRSLLALTLPRFPHLNAWMCVRWLVPICSSMQLSMLHLRLLLFLSSSGPFAFILVVCRFSVLTLIRASPHGGPPRVATLLSISGWLCCFCQISVHLIVSLAKQIPFHFSFKILSTNNFAILTNEQKKQSGLSGKTHFFKTHAASYSWFQYPLAA